MHRDTRFLLQLRKMMVRVENILQGPADLPDTVPIYYFVWDVGPNGPIAAGPP